MSEVKPIIIGVTGLPAAGKGLFSDIAKQKGFEIIVMGDVIREEVKKRGLSVTRENSNKVMIDLRKEYGPAVVAIKTIPYIEEALKNGKKKILVDGLRSMHELKVFKKHYPSFEVISIHCPPKIRYQRILERHRNDDSKTWEAFEKRDKLELSVGLGDLIALSDYMISNTYQIEQAKQVFNEVIDDVIKRLG